MDETEMLIPVRPAQVRVKVAAWPGAGRDAIRRVPPGKSLAFAMIMPAILVAAAFSESADSPAKRRDDEVQSWFDKKEWLAGWKVRPDASVNKRRLAECYRANPARWDQAFRFLAGSDLAELPLGKQDLNGTRLFVTVSEYPGKKKADARYESHRKYVDIQYVARGEELIGLTTPDKVTVKTPYDEARDIAFYEFEGGEYRKAAPDRFFVFFPEDVHRPSIGTDATGMVKKIVVKLLLGERQGE